MIISTRFAVALLLLVPSTSFAQHRGENGLQIEEVVVSATKREQSLQDVSVSVSAVSGAMVVNAQMDNGTDIARFAPNLNVSYFGLPDQPKYSLRGAATTDFALNTSSATGVLVDEVFLAASYFGGPLLFDIEHIEVLRGPQGTLFGKNTTGGAIQFFTRTPSFETGGYVNAAVGDLGYAHLDGAVEAPIVGKRLAARLAFTYSNSDGFWENENPAGDDLGDIDNRAGRLSLAYQGESWDATLRVVASRSSPKAAGAINEGSNPGGTNLIGVNPRVSPISGRVYDRYEGYWDRSGDIEVKTNGAYLTVHKQFDNYTLTSVTSSINGSFVNLVDVDGSINNLLHVDFRASSDEVQQDLRLASHFSGPFNFIAGLYYFDERSDIPTTNRLFEEFPRDLVPAFAGTASFVTTHYEQQRESYATYFNSTYNFSETLALNLGIRWTDDEGDLTDFTSTGTFINAQSPNIVVPFLSDNPAYDQSYSDSYLSGKLGLDIHLADDSLLYGHYSRGYRSSSFDGTALFSPQQLSTADPETIDTVEFGYKTELFDNRLRLNSAVFFSNYNDMQFLNIISATESQLVNHDAEMYGLEVEATALLGENYVMSIGLGYLEGEYKDAILNGISISGNDLIEAPKLNVNIVLSYNAEFSLGNLAWHLDANYVGEQYFDAFNSPDVATDSFWNVNGKIIFVPGNGNIELSLWGKNLSSNDEYVGRIRSAIIDGVFSIAPQPRRFGVGAVWRF